MHWPSKSLKSATSAIINLDGTLAIDNIGTDIQAWRKEVIEGSREVMPLLNSQIALGESSSRLQQMSFLVFTIWPRHLVRSLMCVCDAVQNRAMQKVSV